jgi:dolichol-phosphate mannosyltransferase
VIVPALNEEEGIGPILKELLLLADVGEIIVVDGGSLDGTAEIAERIGAHVLIERGSGYGKAITRGLQEAKGEFVAVVDADYSYDPSELAKFVSILEENDKIGAVVGSRTGFQKPFTIKFLNFAFRLFFHTQTADVVSSFIVARRNIVLNLGLSSLNFSFPIEVRAKLAKKGYTIVEVPIEYRSRRGEKKLELRHGLSILRAIIGSRL